MIEIKTFDGGINLDDSQYRLPPNDYIDANNISHDAVEGSNDRIITPIIANRLVSYTFHSGGTPTTIGSFSNTLRNTIIELVYHPTGYHSIVEFNLTTRVRSKIFENLTDSGEIDILGFTLNGKITGMDIYNRQEGDLFFFLDSLGRPTGLDIEKFRVGAYTPVTREILDKAKKPPLSPPQVIYDNDITRRSNALRNKLFRFKYRWIYDDFEKSTFSPIGKVPLPVGILSDAYTNTITNNNVIRGIAKSGGKNVKAIEICMSYVDKTNDWSDFKSIEEIKKTSLALTVSTNIDHGTSGSDLTIETFSGVGTVGEVINVYLKLLPNTSTLVGTYTVLTGDSLASIAAGLAANMVTLGIALSPFSYFGKLVFAWLNATYSFDRVDIIPAAGSTLDNIDFPFAFYNDSTYPDIDIEESIQLFDYIPQKANAQALLNGNILAYAGITEGYDKDTVANETITIGTVAATAAVVSSFNAVRSLSYQDATKRILKYVLSGIPGVGTIIELKAKRKSDHTIITFSSYTTTLIDTIYTIEKALSDNLSNSYPYIYITYGYGNVFTSIDAGLYEPISGSAGWDNPDWSEMIITPPITSGNSIPTWKWSTSRTIARAYFDKFGVTNGVLYTNKITFPAYAENGDTPAKILLPYIHYEINDTPPIWAESMQFLINKDNDSYKFWKSNGVNNSEAEFIYFDVTSFLTNAEKRPITETVLGYTFKEGDRVRIIRDNDSPGIVFDDTYDCLIEGLVANPTINLIPPTTGQTHLFVKIKKIEPFTTGIINTKNYILELYSPAQQNSNGSNQVFFEFGQEYGIIDAGLSTRRHSGMVQDQVVGLSPAIYNFYEGDAYFRPRTIAEGVTGVTGYSLINVMDRNFVDFYISAVSSVDGRPNIIDINARQAYYSTLIRHGQAYQADTNINGLNRFYSKNFDEYDYSYGDVQDMVVKERQLIIGQKFKIGTVTLYSSIGKDSNGNTVFFQTDKLLNPINYYAGNVGMGTTKQMISFGYVIYGGDNIKGAIWRLSQDGVIILSQLYKMNSWANDNLRLRAGYQIYLAYDQRLSNLIVHLEAIECVGIALPDFTINNAIANEAFSQTIILTGTLPYTLSLVVKPAWMTITVSGNDIVFSGTPTSGDVGSNIGVSFDIANDCGLVTANKTINVTTPPCIAVVIVGSPVLPDATIDVPYSYSFDITGTAPFTLSAVSKPAWMTIAVSGSSIVFSGTPSVSAIGEPIGFTINNCSSNTVVFEDIIDVSANNWLISYTNNDATVNIQLHIGNNGSSPSNTIYNGLYTTDPITGSDVVNLPATNAMVVLSIGSGKIITVASCNGIAGVAGGSSVTWTGITSGTLTISFTTANVFNYRLSASYAMSIDSVTGIGVPSPALGSTGINGTLFGYHTAMSSALAVTISGATVLGTSLRILKNSVVTDTVSIAAGPNVYNLANPSAVEADYVEIIIVL